MDHTDFGLCWGQTEHRHMHSKIKAPLKTFFVCHFEVNQNSQSSAEKPFAEASKLARMT
jgi:hypothetical protein